MDSRVTSKNFFLFYFFFLTYFQLNNIYNDSDFGYSFFCIIVSLDLSFLNRRNPFAAFY